MTEVEDYFKALDTMLWNDLTMDASLQFVVDWCEDDVIQRFKKMEPDSVIGAWQKTRYHRGIRVDDALQWLSDHNMSTEII